MDHQFPLQSVFSPEEYKIYSQNTSFLSPNQIFCIGKISYHTYHFPYPNRFLILYSNTIDYYLDIIPKKKNITVNNFWICDIQHYLQLLLDGQFDRTYYLSHGEIEWNSNILPYQRSFLQFITDCNHRSVYKTVSNLYQFNRKYLLKRNQFQKINFLQAFQHHLMAEQILRNIWFPSSNIYYLKKNHPFEPYIDQFLQLNTGIQNIIEDDQPISDYLSRSLLEVLDNHMIYLKKLSEKDKILINYPDLVKKGNQLFRDILSRGLS